MLLDKIKMEFIGTIFITFVVSLSATNFMLGEGSVMSYAMAKFALITVFTWIGVAVSGA